LRLNQWRKPHYIKATSCRTIMDVIGRSDTQFREIW